MNNPTQNKIVEEFINARLELDRVTKEASSNYYPHRDKLVNFMLATGLKEIYLGSPGRLELRLYKDIKTEEYKYTIYWIKNKTK